MNRSNQTRLFFDIETVPCEEPDKEYFIKVFKERNKNNDKKGLLSDEELYESTSLEAISGRICCIAYIAEGAFGIKSNVLCSDEKDMLVKFWECVQESNLLIGHNILGFDIPFILQRSVILGVEPCIKAKNISFRYTTDFIYDTQKEWSRWDYYKSQKLDTIAHALKIPSSKDSLDGLMVWPKYKEGKIEEICNYCMKDVEVVRQVYYKMNFIKLPQEDSTISTKLGSD